MLLLAMGPLAGPEGAWAATPGKIGFIDMKRLESESALGKDAARSLKTEQQEEDELQALEKEVAALRRTRDKLSAEERQKQAKGIEEKVQAIEDRKGKKLKERHGKRERVTREFRQKVREEVRRYAKEQGFEVVLVKGRGLFYGDERSDITGPIIERLNKEKEQIPGAETAKPTPKP